jgi:hypothetical protein
MMTDDLVKRLRDLSYNQGHDLPDRAAARIERLELALAHIYAWYPISVSEPIKTIKEISIYARKALEGKDG